MARPLADLKNSIIAGLVPTVVIFIIVRALTGASFRLDAAWFSFFVRWLHVMSGVMWFGTIMSFNLWEVIRPNQQKALGMIEIGAGERAEAARTAMQFSRANTLLSIPMLSRMVAMQNGDFA